MERDPGEGGYLTLQYLVVIGLSLVLFTALANLMVFQYARGVVRASLDEGARDGARTIASAAAAVTTCETRARAARDGLVSGRLADGIQLSCRVEPDVVVAYATVRLPGWIPLVPDWHFEESATAMREVEP